MDIEPKTREEWESEFSVVEDYDKTTKVWGLVTKLNCPVCGYPYSRLSDTGYFQPALAKTVMFEHFRSSHPELIKEKSNKASFPTHDPYLS